MPKRKKTSKSRKSRSKPAGSKSASRSKPAKKRTPPKSRAKRAHKSAKKKSVKIRFQSVKSRLSSVKIRPKSVRTRFQSVQSFFQFVHSKFSRTKTLKITLGTVILFLIALYFFKDLPLPTKLTSYSFPASTQIFSRDGQLLYEIYADKNRVPVALEDLPDYVKWATIASEDKDFYSHHGFAFRGIIRAAFNTLFRRSLQGGSTITQQLVKNALLTPDRTLKRKVREAVLAFTTEVIYTKDQILEMYLNQVPYGGTAWGIQAAAQTYFDKNAKNLSLAEAALLAGLPASPTRFSPFGAHPELAKSRQERVLTAMVEEGYLPAKEAEEAKNRELEYAPAAIEIRAPHFALWVKELLVEKYGERLVEQGGLKVYTTLDLAFQEETQKIIAGQVEAVESRQVSNGAALVTNPKTGEILAMIGSRDYFDNKHDGKVNVTIRPRQPGSSIKPLNYALGIEKKTITPATTLNDMPTCFTVAGQKPYCPVNYDGRYRGPIQVRFALGGSVNIPAVKVLALNGVADFINFARSMGITTWEDPSRYGLSLTLGGGEVKMIDMATAFGVFANLGVRQDIYGIERIVDNTGKEIFAKKEDEGPRVLSIETAYLISHILLDNNARAGTFGSFSDLVISGHPEVSVKTGTTNDFRDAWTIGYNPSRLVAVWMGNNDNSQMRYGTAGAVAAAPAWNEIMSFVLQDREEEWPPQPEGIVGAQVCTSFSQSSEDGTSCPTRFEYFLKDTVPEAPAIEKRFMEIDKSTGLMATDATPPENREMREFAVVLDALGTPFCLGCPEGAPSTIVRYPLSETQ